MIKIVVSNYEQYHTPFQVKEMYKYEDLDISYFTGMRPKRIKSIFKKDSKRVRNLFSIFLLPRVLEKIIPSKASYLRFKEGDCFDSIVSKKRIIRRADIIHSYNGFALKTFIRAAPHTFKIVECGVHPKYYYDICKREYEKYDLDFSDDYGRYIEKSMKEFELADLVLTQTKICKESFLQNGIPEEKIKCIPLGVNVNGFHKVCDKDKLFTILYVGRVTVLKGVQYLIEACEKLHENGIKIHLNIVGPITDSYMGNLERKYRESDYISFCGKKDSQELLSFYSKASVFVMPSLIDSFCMAVYESLACETPVIITENVGAPINEGKNGFVIPIRSSGAIFEKIKYFYDHLDLIDSFGKDGKAMVSRYTWQKYAEQLAELYADSQKRKN